MSFFVSEEIKNRISQKTLNVFEDSSLNTGFYLLFNEEKINLDILSLNMSEGFITIKAYLKIKDFIFLFKTEEIKLYLGDKDLGNILKNSLLIEKKKKGYKIKLKVIHR